MEEPGFIYIAANKNNKVEAWTLGGAVGAASAYGNVALAKDRGSAAIEVNTNNEFSANIIAISSNNNPEVIARVDNDSANLLGGGAGVANATASGSAITTIGSGNEFDALKVGISANVGTQCEDKNSAKATLLGVNIALGGNVIGNVATATTAMEVKVDVGANTYKTTTKQDVISTTYNENGIINKQIIENDTYGVTDLTIVANNTTNAKADAKGITVGGIVAIGTNIAKTNTTVVTERSEERRVGKEC